MTALERMLAGAIIIGLGLAIGLLLLLSATADAAPPDILCFASAAET